MQLNSTLKQVLVAIVLVLLAFGAYRVITTNMSGAHEANPSYSELVNDVQTGKVKDATINGTAIQGHYANGESFHATGSSNDSNLSNILLAHGVNFTFKDENNFWLSTLVGVAPFVLFLLLWFFLLRQMQSGGNKAMSFGKSRARLLSMQQKKVTFKDVAGVDELPRKQLKEIIEFPARGAEVPAARRAHTKRRAAGRASGHRQDAAGPRGRRRSQCAVLLHLRFRLR